MALRPDISEYKIRKKILKKMGFDSYKDYLASLDWLLRKNQIINFYLKNELDIKCECCKTTNNLCVHHNWYDCMEKDIVDEYEIANYSFLCGECHTKIHYNDKFLKDLYPDQTPEEMEEWRLLFERLDAESASSKLKTSNR